MTRARAKRMKEALNGLVQDIWAKSLAQHDLYTFEGTSKLQNIIQAQEQAQEHQSLGLGVNYNAIRLLFF